MSSWVSSDTMAAFTSQLIPNILAMLLPANIQITKIEQTVEIFKNMILILLRNGTSYSSNT